MAEQIQDILANVRAVTLPAQDAETLVAETRNLFRRNTENRDLSITWHDSAWIPHLNPTNVMDYFAERSNPFYDRQCNNEQIKMQRLSPDQLQNMTGIEYYLLHIDPKDPMLYVIRKQHRHSPTQATALADFYIISGVVYRAPDLGSVLNSRLLNILHNLQSSFSEAHSFVRYHPSKGYTWRFKDADKNKKTAEEKSKPVKREEPSSMFQRQRVDDLLADLTQKFPPKTFTHPAAQLTQPPPQPAEKQTAAKQGEATIKQEKPTIKVDKSEDKNSLKPPPEKKAKLMR